MALQSTKRNFFVTYIALSIISTATAFSNLSNAKHLAASGIGASLLGLISTELAFGKAETELEKAETEVNNLKFGIEKLEKDIKTKDEINATNASKLTDKHSLIIQGLTDRLDNSSSQIAEQKQRNSELAKKLEKTQQELLNERGKLQKAYQYNSDAIHEILRKSYNQQVKYVESLIEGFNRFYPEHSKSFDQIVIEVDKFKSRYTQKLSEYEKITSAQDLLEEGLELQKRMIGVSTNLRLKAQTVVISHLQGVTKESVTFSEEQNLIIQNLESSIDEANHRYGKQVDWTGQVKEKLEGNIKAFAQEFIEFRDRTIQDYRTEFTEILEALKDAANRLENYESQIFEMDELIQKLKLPHLFPGGVEKSTIANSIINYYWTKRKICLDCAFWTDTELGYILHFYAGRNAGVLITPKILNDQDADYQLQNLSQSLELPKFELDTEKLCMSLEIVKRRKSKVKSEIKLPRGVRTEDKFADIVSKWERVRITGGSESGKSPTAENIAVCILKSRKTGDITFYDPMHDSLKNYRSIPAAGHTHEDSIEGLKEFAKTMQESPSADFRLVWFDEIDSTLDESPGSSKHLKAIFKQGSHKNLGLILTGQNSNVSAISGKPPIQRSDMKNMVVVHIGSNYEDGLTNSNLPESEKKSLGDIGLKVMEYCNHMNDTEGLVASGKDSDTYAYRFALVLEPNKRGYFMLLPEFGLYDYQQLEKSRGSSAGQCGNSADDIRPNAEPVRVISTNCKNDNGESRSIENSDLSKLLSGKKLESSENTGNITCPKCGTNNVTIHDSLQNRYKCLNSECTRKTFRFKADN